MKLERAIEILEKHQEWRRDQNVPPKIEMQNPIEIGTAIDSTLSELKKLRLGGVSPRLFYVVAHSQYTEGSWEQISNGFDTYEKAIRYRDDNFCKSRYPNAFIVASLNER